MSLKVVAERDILSVMSVLTREAGESSFLIDSGVRVYERSRLFEVLNDVAFRVEDDPAPERGPEQDDGRGSEDREREPQSEAGQLRGGKAAVAAEGDDRVPRGRTSIQREFSTRRQARRAVADAKSSRRRRKGR